MSIASAGTLALPISAVIPRPIAAGVFGMARTIGVFSPRTSSKVAIGVPAATEITSVSPLPKAPTSGKASAIICGFTAITAIAGLSGKSAPMFTPCALSQSDGCGSITNTDFGGSPVRSQPRSIAEPILPHPSITSPRVATSFISMKAPLNLNGERLRQGQATEK